jgi:PAS domain S-box-containing protein
MIEQEMRRDAGRLSRRLPIFDLNLLSHWTGRYGLTVCAVAASALLRWLMPDVLSRAPYLGFYPAVVVAAILGGVGPGLAATFGSMLLVNFVFVQFHFMDYGLQMRNVIWILGGVGVSFLAGELRRAHERLQQSNSQLEQRIADRKRAEEILRRQADMLRLSFDAIIVWRLDGGIESWNRGAEELYGFLSDEATGRIPHELLQTKFPVPWSQIETMLRNSGSWEGELQHQTRSGQEVIVSARLQLIRGADGTARVLEINRDITAHKKAEERMAFRHTVTAALAEAGDAAEGAQLLLERIVAQLGWVGGELWLIDESIGRLRRKSFWPVPEGSFDEVASAGSELTFGCGEGFPGSIWAGGKAVWMSDLSALQAPRAEAARKAGLHTLLALPIRSGSKIMGVLILADRETRASDNKLMQLADDLGSQIGQFFQRKQAEEALRASHERLTKVLEVETVGVMFWDLTTGRLTDANDTFLKMMGYSRSDIEACNLTWQEFTPPEYHEVSLAEIRKFQATGRVGPYEKEYFQKDGTKRWLLFAGSSLGGNTCVEFCVDIAERKKAEEALRQSEQRFRMALRNAPVSVGVQDRDLRYVWAYNLRTAQIDDVIGHTDAELFAPEEAAHVRAMKLRVMEEDIELQEQIWLTRPGGRIFLGTYWEPIHDSDGRVIGVGSATVDLTPIKLAEERLAHLNDELELRVTERTAELARKATQLRALAGELTLSEQRERSRLAKILHDHLQQLLVGAKFRLAIVEKGADDLIQRALKEVEDLIDESVAVSRDLTAELNPPILQEAGLNAGLQWLVRRMADKHGLFIELEMESDGSIPEQLRIFLFDSIRELLFNIVKHAHTSSAALSLRHVDGRLQVTISDMGVGFDPGTMPAAGGGGVGYGLFSIRERLEMLGGTLHIHSTPGEGSRIVLSVPNNPIESIDPQSRQIPELPETQTLLSNHAGLERKIRVLLADDHAVVREGIANLLSNERDFDIVGQAANGKEAVELALTLLPDVILMDSSMPTLGGIDATRIILKEHPGISILGLSMFDEPDIAQAMRDAGAADYLTKSGPADRLIKAIRACTSH